MKECRSATDTQRTKLKDRKEFAKMKRGFSHGHNEADLVSAARQTSRHKHFYCLPDRSISEVSDHCLRLVSSVFDS